MLEDKSIHVNYHSVSETVYSKYYNCIKILFFSEPEYQTWPAVPLPEWRGPGQSQPFLGSHFLGYTKDEEGNLIIEPAEAEVVKRIYQECLEGPSLLQIGRGLEVDGILTGLGKRSGVRKH